MPDVKKLERMNERSVGDDAERRWPSAVNLMVHPVAGAAAAFPRLASAWPAMRFGVWMGAVSGAAEASQRMFSPIFDEFARRRQSSLTSRGRPPRKAQAATKTLIDDARSAAQEIADTADALSRTERAAELLSWRRGCDAADLMPEDFRQPKAMDTPEASRMISRRFPASGRSSKRC